MEEGTEEKKNEMNNDSPSTATTENKAEENPKKNVESNPNTESYADKLRGNKTKEKTSEKIPEGLEDDVEESLNEEKKRIQDIENFICQCSEKAVHTNFGRMHNNDDNEDLEVDEGNEWIFGYLSKVIYRNISDENKKETRTGNSYGKSTISKKTPIGFLYFGNNISQSVSIKGFIENEKNPNENPFHIFAVRKHDINFGNKSISSEDMNMITMENVAEFVHDPAQLLELFPKLMGKISVIREENRLVVIPWELMQNGKDRNIWKKNEEIKLKFGMDEDQLQLLSNGEQVYFTLIMGADGPMAVDVQRGTMINPSNLQADDYDFVMCDFSQQCPIRKIAVPTYHSKVHIEVNTYESVEINEHIKKKTTSAHCIHFVPTARKSKEDDPEKEDPFKITAGDIAKYLTDEKSTKTWRDLNLDEIVQIWKETRSDQQISTLNKLDEEKKQEDWSALLAYNVIIHFVNNKNAIATNILVSKSYNKYKIGGHDHIQTTMVIANADAKGAAGLLRSQLSCNKLYSMINFNSGLRNNITIFRPDGREDVEENLNLQLLSFADRGDTIPCQVNQHSKEGTHLPKVDDVTNFIIHYDPGNQSAKDKIVELSNEVNKKISVKFINEKRKTSIYQTKGNKKKNNKKRKDTDTLFHGKLVRASITIIKDATLKIVKELKSVGIIVGHSKDMQTRGKKIYLRSKRWTPFPAKLFELTKDNDVHLITVLDKHYFAIYTDIASNVDKILEKLELNKAANSKHLTFFAPENTPWAQVCIEGTDTIINTKYEHHTMIKNTQLYIKGFDTVYRAAYIEQLLNNSSTSNQKYEIIDTQPNDLAVDKINCQFLTCPHSNPHSNNTFTLEITSNQTTIKKLKENANKIAEQSNKKLGIMIIHSHELITHSKVRSTAAMVREETEEVAPYEAPNQGYETVLRKHANKKNKRSNDTQNQTNEGNGNISDFLRPKTNNTSNNNNKSNPPPSHSASSPPEERKVEKGDFDISQDTKLRKWLTNQIKKLKGVPPTMELTKSVHFNLCNLTVRVDPEYHKQASLKPSFYKKTGLGGLISNFLKTGTLIEVDKKLKRLLTNGFTPRQITSTFQAPVVDQTKHRTPTVSEWTSETSQPSSSSSSTDASGKGTGKGVATTANLPRVNDEEDTVDSDEDMREEGKEEGDADSIASEDPSGQPPAKKTKCSKKNTSSPNFGSSPTPPPGEEPPPEEGKKEGKEQ